MKVNIVTIEDLEEFKAELFNEIKILFHIINKEEKLWLLSGEMKELFKISTVTLQKLRTNGSLSYTLADGDTILQLQRHRRNIGEEAMIFQNTCINYHPLF